MECAICADERQYVPPTGQRWTSLAELRESGHRGEIRELEPDLHGIGVSPSFAIGQRGLIVRTVGGNLLWDVPGYIDDDLAAAVDQLGGLAVITASHPHFYGVMVEWAHAFPGATILLPAVDRRWARRDDPSIQTWSDTHAAVPGVTLVQCGGHFEGSAVAHWAAGAGGKGAMLVGDTITVTPGADRVAIMRSYPNYIPLPELSVRRVAETVARYPYDRMYGGWWDAWIRDRARQAVQRSVERSLAWQRGDADDDSRAAPG